MTYFGQPWNHDFASGTKNREKSLRFHRLSHDWRAGGRDLTFYSSTSGARVQKSCQNEIMTPSCVSYGFIICQSAVIANCQLGSVTQPKFCLETWMVSQDQNRKSSAKCSFMTFANLSFICKLFARVCKTHQNKSRTCSLRFCKDQFSKSQQLMVSSTFSVKRTMS